MSDGPTTNPPATVKPTPTTAAPRSCGPSVLQIAIVVTILGVGILVTALSSDVTRVSEPGVRLVDGKPYLPEQTAGWVGGPLEGLSDEERKVLPVDTEGARRLYTDKDDNEVFCSIVLAGRDVTSIHRPELCLSGQGWKIENEYTEPISADGVLGGVLRVMRMNTTRTFPLADGGTAQTRFIFVYWFVGKDRVTPHHWQRILWTTKDRVLHNRNHRWAYILIYAPVTAEQAGRGPHRNETETMQLISRFVRDIYPGLVAGWRARPAAAART